MSPSSLYQIQSQSACLCTQVPCNRQSTQCESCNAATSDTLHLNKLVESYEGLQLSKECQSFEFVWRPMRRCTQRYTAVKRLHAKENHSSVAT